MKIGVIIPTYKARQHIKDVILSIGPEVSRIYIVDDFCPENTGDFVKENCKDSRIILIRHKENQGVGGAVMSGYKAALKDCIDILVKVDSDGQMNPKKILDLIQPILNGKADYTKGNRFIFTETIFLMPKIRLFGNIFLSFLNKISSGYWNIFDSNNGFTAIHADVASLLPFEKISKDFFFESDMLFRLNLLRAVVIDVPVKAIYANEKSNLSVTKSVFIFSIKHLRNIFKRILYNYYFKDFSIASIMLPLGFLLLLFGVIYGGMNWMQSSISGLPTIAGTIILSATSIIVGFQLLLTVLAIDINSVPKKPFCNNKKY